MNIISRTSSIIFLCVVCFFLVVSSFVYNTAYSENYYIPSWVRDVASWWSQGEIHDEEFFQLLQFLVDKEIIVIPNDNLLLRIQQLETELDQQKAKQDMNFINQIDDRGDFKLVLRQTETYQREYEILDARLTGEIDYLNQLLKLPYDISVIAHECKESNAFYDYQSRAIIFCYELVDEFYNIFSNEEFFYDVSQDVVYDAVDSNIIETLYHEIGHMMFMSWDIPFTGLEENVADQFAVFFIWLIYDDESINFILYDVGSYYFVQDQYYIQDQSDVHSLDLQRYYNIACYAYGFDKDYNQNLITDGWLPLNRSYDCEYEFDRLVYGFTNVFENYVLTDE